MAKAFKDLSEREVLALAISLEEDDERIYGDFAEVLRKDHSNEADVFERMRKEEAGHRRRLIELFQQRFGDHIPLVRRHHVKGFVSRKPVWLSSHLGLDAMRRTAESMELETRRFYETAARRTTDAGIRQLLNDLAAEERGHTELAGKLQEAGRTGDSAAEEEKARRRLFVLQVVQPGLAGLMDGSVSTLAPVFAAAFATQNCRDAFLVGMAASLGAGISMGFAEALSDDGTLSGRGRPWIRGAICGVMTALGGVGHTLPYLISSFQLATAVAVLVVLVELSIISWIRHRYMDTPLMSAAFQVMVGGFLVFLAGILIGSA